MLVKKIISIVSPWVLLTIFMLPISLVWANNSNGEMIVTPTMIVIVGTMMILMIAGSGVVLTGAVTLKESIIISTMAGMEIQLAN